jgi:Flp pilus assembly protein TadD
MVAGEATDLVVVGAGLEDGFLITARIIDSHGVDRARPTVSLGERVRDGGHGDVMLHATIAPTELAPGRYSLLLSVDNRSSGEPLSRILRVEVASSQQPYRTAASEDPVPQTAAESLELQAREIGSVSAQTVALLLSGQRGGEIAGSLIWTVSPRLSDDGLSEVLVFIDTDGRTLLEEHTDLQLDVGFFAYVFSDEGHLVDHLAEGLSLDLESYEEILLARGLKFAGRFSLPPGAYFVRLLVRNQNSGRLFLTQARIDVPDEQGGERVLLPPIFEEQRGGWIVARQSNIEEGGVGVELSEEIVLPASRVVVESRQQTPFFLGGAGWNDESPVTARVADSQGRQLAEPTLIIDGGVGSVDGSIRFFHAVLDPLDLPPGFYTLEVTLDDETTGARLSRYVPLAVVVRRGPLVLQAGLSVSGNPVLLPDGTTAISAPTVSEAEFAARYADALYLLGEGDRYAARDAVVELERSAAKNGGRRDLARISKVERQVVRELADADPDVLRPICLLHRDVFRQHLAFGDDRLADIAWPLAAELAETVNQQRSVGDSPFFAETLLVSLAADLIRAAAVTSAIELLDRAIAIAPDDPSALLALGATYERSGRYEEAIGPLRRLVREHPGNSEGELRLAVNLARDGKVDEAKVHFRHLIEDSAPTWMTVLAYQELARLEPLLMAEAVLAEGVERYPNNQALRVQLAFVLDSRGRTDEATQLVEDVCRRASAPETSPRVRYPTWPSLGIEGKIVRFEEETEILLPALVASLDARAVPENPEDAT